MRGYLVAGVLAGSWVAIAAATADAAAPWSGTKRERAEADPTQSYRLTEQHGPWMIYAASFAGPTAEEEALRLVHELRERFRLESYLHVKKFDLSETVPGLGFDKYGNPKKMRHRIPVAFDEYAVMVGNFDAYDNEEAEKQLEMLKYCHPKCLDLESGSVQSLRFAGLRAFHRAIHPEKGKRGPLGKAFITRNPMLPDEFFTPKGVDKLVASMNEGVPHSLLDCPGEYTVRVATFRGTVTIDQAEIKRLENSKELPTSKLAQAADKAHRLTEMLRAKGVEAYEFHDRHESIVTVGSFDSVGAPRKDGRIEINPAVYKVMQKFSPQQRVLPNAGPQPMAGLVPLAMGGIPFDIQPLPVKVPRRSIATDYISRGITRGGSVR